MSTPPSVDRTVQRDHLLPPPGQADTPGPPHTLHGEGPNKTEVSKDGFTSPSGPDTPEARGEITALSPSLTLSPSTLLLSSPTSSSSPHSSSNEDSPQEASSSDSSDYDFESSEEDEIYGSGYESDNVPEGKTLVRVENAKSDKSVTGEEDDKIRAGSPAPATRGWQYQYFRSRPDTCLGGGWVPGNPLPNRTYANEHIAVRESPLQGHGFFAAADIKEGTEVLMEAPLIRARSLERLCARRARLGEEERAVYDGLVGYHEFDTCPVTKRWSANSFELAMGYNGVFAIASNFNHACKSRRNTRYEWDQREEVMTFTAIRDIEKGEEMLVSYCNYRHVLKEVYGFVCHCGGCDNQAVDLGEETGY